MTIVNDSQRGQILTNSPFGEMLTSLAVKSETIVEIGTWRGLGSTLCLSCGLRRESQRMWTIEQDPTVHAEAKGYYNDPRIVFLNAHALDIPPNTLPPKIDLMLFDGSDETTDAEFDAYGPRCKVVALDDTNERKNRRQWLSIINSPEWDVLANEPEDRNGWMIARRRE